MRISKLLLISAFLLWSGVCFGADYNYYFKNGGSDSYDCSSNALACASLSKMQEKGNDHGSGDNVYIWVARGDSWSDNSAAPGAAYNVTGLRFATLAAVHLGSYDSGDSSTVRPIFDGLVSDWDNVAAHDLDNGPRRWYRFFEFIGPNSSITDIELRRTYAHGVYLKDTGSTGFTMDDCYIQDFGNSGIGVNTNSTDVTVQYSTFYLGQRLYEHNKQGDGGGWEGAITLKKESGTKPTGAWIHHNLVYDIYGEGINVSNGIIEYNVVGNTGSLATMATSHNWDAGETIIRYNLIMMEDWGQHIYDSHSGGDRTGVRVFDEQAGGDNDSCNVEIYGNVIINRSWGIRLYANQGEDWTCPIKIFNNTIIDSHTANIYIQNPESFDDVTIQNNASILYDRTSSLHAQDTGDISSYGYTISHNAYWTDGGSPSVDSNWQSNYVITDPKLAGEGEIPEVDWDGQTGSTYFVDITFANVTPESGSSLLGGYGTNLSTWETQFLMDGTDWDEDPANSTWQLGTVGTWNIGAYTYEEVIGTRGIKLQ